MGRRRRAARSIGLVLAVALLVGCDTETESSAALEEARRIVCDPIRRMGVTFEAPDPGTYAGSLDHAVLLLAGSGQGEVARAVQTLAERARADFYVLTAFLMGSPSDGDVDRLRAELESREYVVGVDYVSQAEAFDAFVETYEDRPELHESLNRSALPATLEIHVDDVGALEDLADELEGDPLVDVARYSLAPGGGIDGLAPADRLRVLRLCAPVVPTEGFPGRE